MVSCPHLVSCAETLSFSKFCLAHSSAVFKCKSITGIDHQKLIAWAIASAGSHGAHRGGRWIAGGCANPTTISASISHLHPGIWQQGRCPAVCCHRSEVAGHKLCFLKRQRGPICLKVFEAGKRMQHLLSDNNATGNTIDSGFTCAGTWALGEISSRCNSQGFGS